MAATQGSQPTTAGCFVRWALRVGGAVGGVTLLGIGLASAAAAADDDACAERAPDEVVVSESALRPPAGERPGPARPAAAAPAQHPDPPMGPAIELPEAEAPATAADQRARDEAPGDSSEEPVVVRSADRPGPVLSSVGDLGRHGGHWPVEDPVDRAAVPTAPAAAPAVAEPVRDGQAPKRGPTVTGSAMAGVACASSVLRGRSAGSDVPAA